MCDQIVLGQKKTWVDFFRIGRLGGRFSSESESEYHTEARA
jgi:hypothetical protein